MLRAIPRRIKKKLHHYSCEVAPPKDCIGCLDELSEPESSVGWLTGTRGSSHVDRHKGADLFHDGSCKFLRSLTCHPLEWSRRGRGKINVYIQLKLRGITETCSVSERKKKKKVSIYTWMTTNDNSGYDNTQQHFHGEIYTASNQ